MFQTVEARIDENGNVKLLQKIKLKAPHRVLVTSLDEPAFPVAEITLLSEDALGDWNRPEEDEAWAYLQCICLFADIGLESIITNTKNGNKADK